MSAAEEIAALRRELDELLEDKARLDWLLANAYEHKTCDNGEVVFLSVRTDTRLDAVRTAIDAARAR